MKSIHFILYHGYKVRSQVFVCLVNISNLDVRLVYSFDFIHTKVMKKHKKLGNDSPQSNTFFTIDKK